MAEAPIPKPFAALEWHANKLWVCGARIGLVVGYIWQEADAFGSWAYETAGQTISGAVESETAARLALELAVRRIAQ